MDDPFHFCGNGWNICWILLLLKDMIWFCFILASIYLLCLITAMTDPKITDGCNFVHPPPPKKKSQKIYKGSMVPSLNSWDIIGRIDFANHTFVNIWLLISGRNCGALSVFVNQADPYGCVFVLKQLTDSSPKCTRGITLDNVDGVWSTTNHSSLTPHYAEGRPFDLHLSAASWHHPLAAGQRTSLSYLEPIPLNCLK